jgi:hypothetical protein
VPVEVGYCPWAEVEGLLLQLLCDEGQELVPLALEALDLALEQEQVEVEQPWGQPVYDEEQEPEAWGWGLAKEEQGSGLVVVVVVVEQVHEHGVVLGVLGLEEVVAAELQWPCWNMC